MPSYLKEQNLCIRVHTIKIMTIAVITPSACYRTRGALVIR